VGGQGAGRQIGSGGSKNSIRYNPVVDTLTMLIHCLTTLKEFLSDAEIILEINAVLKTYLGMLKTVLELWLSGGKLQ
jgi:hypothetical protein